MQADGRNSQRQAELITGTDAESQVAGITGNAVDQTALILFTGVV